MQHSIPVPRPPSIYSIGLAMLIFVAFALLLPMAIFPWQLPQSPPSPADVDPIKWPPPRLKAALPVTAPSPQKAPIAAPDLIRPDPTPDLKPLDIRPDPFRPPPGGIRIDGIPRGFDVEVLPEGQEQLDQPPEVLVQPAPRITWRPRSRMSVLTELIVEKDGRVSSVRVLAADNDELAAAAVAAASKWRFQPGTKDGKPVRFRMRQRFDFQP